jgi:hypothetical protein
MNSKKEITHMSDQRDAYGVQYQSNSTPTAGSQIMVRDSTGKLVPGTWMGQAVKN